MMTKRNDSRDLRPRFLSVLISAILIASFLSGCNLNFTSSSDDKPSGTDPEDLATPIVEINFTLSTPAILPEGERIVLEVLDEVTGLPYNGHLYDMTKVGDQLLTLTLPYPSDSVVKYRYVKIGAAITPEVTALGEEVRYRLYHVTGPASISDHLQRWQGDPSTTEMGALTGSLTDQATGLPAPDILVSVAGNLTYTDANGKFVLEGIKPGVHNLVYYALDGKYRPFQQGASIAAGMSTTANATLTPMPLIQVTFNVTPPNEALGVPIYLAGNLIQLGNTFSNLAGGMNLKPKRMPLLVPQDDGTFILTLDLYAGTDLRYKFTLGDGYWNSEQQATGGIYLRQLIVPDHAVTLDLSIATWKTPGFEPVTFDITIPSETSPDDEKYIQFKTVDWTEPIPLWPLGEGKFLYIVFSPLEATKPLTYRFCRNEACDQTRNIEALSGDAVIQPSTTAQLVAANLTQWENWKQQTEPTEVLAANILAKSASYATIVELTPEMDPSWRVYAPIGMTELAEIGAQTVIFTPQWYVSAESNHLNPDLGQTPFKSDLVMLSEAAGSLGLQHGLFPQVGPLDSVNSWWLSQSHSEAWWRTWFESYERFMLNYAQIAAETGAERLVIGGKAVLPAIPGGVFPDGSDSDVPDAIEVLWQDLLDEIKKVYGGKLVWATNAQISMDPLPSFIDQFDEIYITIDSPLSVEETPSLDLITAGFNGVIDSQIYETYLLTQKPIIVALAYPAVTGAVQGCALLDTACSNDGLFLPNEIASLPVDLSEQVLIYNATLPVLASRDWIEGIAVRGVDPIVTIKDGSSSILGKPAQDVIWYWFSNLLPE